jgi:hypothetical protein
MVTLQFCPKLSYKFLIKLSLEICVSGTELAIRILDNPQSRQNAFLTNRGNTMSRFSLFFLVCWAVTALAWAGTAPVMSQFDPSQIVLSPSGEIRDRAALDDAQPDTLLYDNGAIAGFWQTSQLWSRVRFTAPDAFELRSIYFITNNPNSNPAVCSLYVFSSNAGQMGTQLSAFRVAGTVLRLNAWNDVNLPAPVQIDSAQEFFVIVGPAPGGLQNQGWHVISDGTPNSDRSMKSSTGHAGAYTSADGDWLIRAGGSAAAFVDLTAEECYDQTSAGPRFSVLTGEDLTFKSQIKNIGNTTVTDFTVDWFVRNPSGTVVFTDQVTGTSLARNIAAQYTGSTTFAPTVNGMYMVGCVVHATGDAVAANDTSWLRLFVGPQPRWFRYDDNFLPDAYTSFTPGNGWGVSFRPVSYTAAIETLRIACNTVTPAAGDVQIWLNDASGTPDTAIWGDTPTLAAGWNLIPVNPPVNIFSGESFTVAFIYTSLSLGQDQNPPNAGDQTHMGTISWQYGGDWQATNSGNWCIQAYLDSSSGMPPYAVIETVPDDTLQFGQVDTTGSTSSTLDLIVYNRGSTDPLNITQMSILPVLIRSVFTINPTTLTVPASDSAIVQITFNPAAVRTYSGSFTITNTSNNMPTLVLTIRAAGVAGSGTSEMPDGSLPGEFALEQNFPNPFNPTTDIRFALPMASLARLTVYNVIGQEIAVLAEGMHSAGVHTVTFDASQLPAGVYFYRLEAGSFSDIRKMLLLK